MASKDQNPLGKATEYPGVFDPGLLFAMPRNRARKAIEIENSPHRSLTFIGYDEWTLYELSWLDAAGSPQVAIGRLQVPADSEYIVESKSLKLYVNSLYYQRFNSTETLINQIVADLDKLLNTRVEFSLLGLDETFGGRETDTYESIDHHSVDASLETNINLLKRKNSPGQFRYKTNRFRSLCPVTGQPDWASIYIYLASVDIDTGDLAQYLAGFSEHRGFHEHCVERIYTDLDRQLEPEKLAVAARYTRRGGIDINPIRASSDDILDMPPRELRQ